MLLELVEMLERRGRRMEEGSTAIGVDNKNTHNKEVNETRKNYYAQNAGVEIAQMKKAIKKIKCEVKTKLVKGNPKRIGTRREDPIAHLMKMR